MPTHGKDGRRVMRPFQWIIAHTPHTSAMPSDAMPPTRIDQRAPNIVPTQPTSGEPIGVAPRKTSD